MAVRAKVQLRHWPEARIFRVPIWERRETAVADSLVAVHLRLIGLVDRARAYILSAQIECIAHLVLDCKTPLHQVRRMKLAIGNGGDRNRRKACLMPRKA